MVTNLVTLDPLALRPQLSPGLPLSEFLERILLLPLYAALCKIYHNPLFVKLQGMHKLEGIPQVGDANTPQVGGAGGERLVYHQFMTHVYLADAKLEERSALRLLLLDLKMEVVGEAADWPTTLAQMPILCPDILLVDWDLLSKVPRVDFQEIRKACKGALVIVLLSRLEARQQAALSAGADAFISKGETPERVAEHLRAVVASVPIK
jgi:CheY-like chemotaxis protein